MTAPPNLGQRTDVVFYDGVCHLCNRTVQFLLRIDRDRLLSFALLQGETAKQLRRRRRTPRNLKTMLFVESLGTDRERISTHSTGVLRILARIGGFWRIVSWLRVVPPPVRDFVYRIIARYRYRWFGRFACPRQPDPDLLKRFLD
jgi:predicted DCC family thiol-disulfide oxidoreductase YuxK